MKLEIGKGSYQMETPIGFIIRITVSDKEADHGAFRVLMAKIALADIVAHRQKDLSFGRDGRIGMPQYFCLHGDWLEIWPKPDQAYDCAITYYPPAMEI